MKPNCCAQGLSFHWQKQFLLNCTFIELPFTFVLRALIHRPSLKGVAKLLTYFRSSTFPLTFPIHRIRSNPFISSSACSSSSKLSFGLKAQIREPVHNPFNRCAHFKSKPEKIKLYSFFFLLINCRRGGKLS